MGKIILYIGIIGLLLISGCHKDNTKLVNELEDYLNNDSVFDLQRVNSTSIRNITQEEEWQSRCWEETMWICQEHCSRVSGLIYSDLLTIDIMQFDYNNDTIIDDSERKEMDYIEWRNRKCMDECIEEEVYDCFR